MKPEELQAASANNYNEVDPVYAAMRKNGAVYNQDSIDKLNSSVGDALIRKDIIPKLTPVTSDVAQQISDASDNGTLSLNHLDQFRRQLSDAKGADSAAAGEVRKAIDAHVIATTGDDLVNGSPDAVALLNRGRAQYTRAANFDDVSTLLQKANGDPTKIKNSLNTFLSDESNTAGMTQPEIAALRRASQSQVAAKL